MALETQLLDLPLSGGLAEQVDKRLVQPGAFLRFQNLEHAKDGSVTNRRGYGYLADPGTTARAVAVRGDELVAFCDGTSTADPQRVMAYRANDDAWTREADAWGVDTRRRPIARDKRGAIAGQRMVIGDRVVFVWANALDGQLSYRIEDADGALVVEDDVSGALCGVMFRVFATDGKACVVYYRSGASYNLWTIDPVTLVETGAGATLALASFAVTSFCKTFDAKPVPNEPGVFAFAAPTGGTLTTQRIGVATYDLSGSMLDSALTAAPLGSNINAIQVAFAANSTFFGVGYRQTTAASPFLEDVRVAKFAYSAGGSIGVAAFDVSAYVALPAPASFALPTTNEEGTVALCQDVVTDTGGFVVATVTDFCVKAKRLDSSGLIAGATDYAVASSFLVSELFVYQSRICAVLGCYVNQAGFFGNPTNNPLICSAALVSIHPGIDENAPAAGVLDPGQHYVMAGGMIEALSGQYAQIFTPTSTVGSFGAMVPSTNADGSTSFAPTAIFGAPTTSSDYAVGIDELTFSPSASTRSFLVASNLLASTGGLTASFDGRDWAELGFFHRPNVYEVVKSTTGGSISNGFYTYAFVYEWIDDEGNVHQSEPAFEQETFAGGGSNQSAQIRVKCLGLTQKPGVVIAMFRTTVNGSLFYRISPRTLSSVVPNRVKANGESQKSVVFTDTLDDNTLQGLGFGFLYTDGGVRGTVLAPPSYHAARHANRVFAINAEDRNEVASTKLLTKQEPPSFGRGLSIRIDGLPEPASALASLDDKLVVFTASQVFYLVGAGPDDTGSNGSFSEAYQVQSDCGCVDPRSVLSTQAGVFFDGPAGTMLLTRSLQVVHVGAPVEDTTAAYPTCLRAQLDAADQRVVWLRESEDGASHIYVVFDYRRASWYTWPIGSLVPTPQIDHCFWRSGHVICDGRPALRGHGGLPSADPDGSYVAGSLRLPWLNAAAVGGFQRLRKIRLTGARNDLCTLRVRVYNDQDDAIPTQDVTFNLASGSTVLDLPRLRLGVDVARQLASQHMVEISHEAAVGTAFDAPRLGFELASVTYELGVKRGPARLAALSRK